jgi:hypothetical protein
MLYMKSFGAISLHSDITGLQRCDQLGPWLMATVQTRLAALSKAHDQYIAGHAHMHMGPEKNPLRDARVRQLISAARRANARHDREAVRPVAATRHVMEALLATCGDDLIGKRDRALPLFGGPVAGAVDQRSLRRR